MKKITSGPCITFSRSCDLEYKLSVAKILEDVFGANYSTGSRGIYQHLSDDKHDPRVAYLRLKFPENNGWAYAGFISGLRSYDFDGPLIKVTPSTSEGQIISFVEKYLVPNRAMSLTIKVTPL